jgi:transcriptional adapter 2-alpha
MSFDFCCSICNLKLKPIFIRCVQCNHTATDNDNKRQYTSGIYICLECFAQGSETGTHRSDHGYDVVNLNRTRTFANWNVCEELALFDDYMCLNGQHWADIARNINDKQAATSNKKMDIECKDHFEDWLGILMASMADSSDKLTDLELFVGDGSFVMRENELGPPRPPLHSQQYRRMSGYRAARGDFETEYNNDYELKVICDIDYDTTADHAMGIDVDAHTSDDDHKGHASSNSSNSDYEGEDLEEDLKLATIHSYRDLICERYKRKKFIRDFGLLNELAINSMNNQYLMNKLQTNQIHAMLPVKFYRLFDTVNGLMQYVELLNYSLQLKRRLAELREYRSHGIRSFKHAEVYKRSKVKRESLVKSAHLSSILTTVIRFSAADRLNMDNCKEWLRKLLMQEQEYGLAAGIGCLASTNQQQSQQQQQPRKYNPLKIENYPESDKLNDEEKEFCRVSRIQPLVYLRVKQILVQECNKAGFVTYSRARKIACIDVNKTRKIHNLLLNLKFIKANDDT